MSGILGVRKLLPSFHRENKTIPTVEDPIARNIDTAMSFINHDLPYQAYFGNLTSPSAINLSGRRDQSTKSAVQNLVRAELYWGSISDTYMDMPDQNKRQITQTMAETHDNYYQNISRLPSDTQQRLEAYTRNILAFARELLSNPQIRNDKSAYWSLVDNYRASML